MEYKLNASLANERVSEGRFGLVWFGLLRIYVALAVFQPYRDLEAGDNQSLKIQVARRGRNEGRKE